MRSKPDTRRRLDRRSVTDERGGVLVMFVLFLPVLILFAAFVLDVGHAFQLRRHLQSAADAAALAAAQELPNTASATSVANDYSASAGGRNENANLPAVTTEVTFPGAPGAKVRVTESAKSRVFFGGILGLFGASFDGFDVSATAVASRSSTTTGTPLAVYVHELCGASTGNKGLIINGQSATIEGGIHVNGHLEIGGLNFVAAKTATVYRPPNQGTSPPTPGKTHSETCKKTDINPPAAGYSRYCTTCSTGETTAPADGPYRDWRTQYNTEAITESLTGCTDFTTTKLENVTVPTPTVYCPSGKFEVVGTVNGNITVIAPEIIVGGRGTLRPARADHPVLFYSTSNKELIVNPSANYDWNGYIINRFGGIVVNANGVTSPFNGLLEAEWILVNGENFRMLGTFPDSSEGGISGAVVLEE
jgi:hypothetical protein